MNYKGKALIKDVAYEARASWAFVERNVNLVKRYWGWEVVWLVYSIANSLAVTFIGAGMEEISGQAMDSDYLILYLLVGTLVWSYLSVVFNSISEMISWERWEGTIEYTFMAPVRRFTHMIGTTLFAVFYGILRTLVILGAIVLFFNISLSNANLGGAIMTLLVGSISFIGFGVLASILPLLFPERGSQMAHIVQALLLLVSGVYYPVETLPDWMQTVAVFSPATYVLEGMRQALLEGESLGGLWPNLWPPLVIGAACIPIGLLIFSRAEKYVKYSGRLKRSG
ncbi:MAG: ABC transporter permease [Candidatus Bipolaricaulota bacterium]